MSTIYEKALAQHKEWKGKISVSSKAQVRNKEDLSLAYSPGVAQPSREIAKDKEKAYDYTWKGNAVAVVSDGSAVLGLGNIGASAAMPVMEGKALLFKEFADIDAVPLCVNSQDETEIIRFVEMVSPSFGGINLEDISAPRCVTIERALVEKLDIPVFHDDQHGTAIVVVAALMNALKLVQKTPENVRIVVSGTGAAGSAIIKMLHNFGVKNILAFNKNGLLAKGNQNAENFLDEELLEITNPENQECSFEQAFVNADVFIGVSAPNIVTEKMVASMNEKAIVFAMANPEPEIAYEKAINAGAYIVGTGRSDYPNQINNVLAFPGLFRGVLDSGVRKITEEMKLVTAKAIASLVDECELSPENIIPSAFHPEVVTRISEEIQKLVRK
ncbi:malate dehydrogenase (oxaloacetate-decarboxylating) [Pilibacter termitis]|uniref:Malate dehydrogenase (Oxaloacetate-decarboxylating) n=1 Tax=Pilibacter termitis TaxID=263852 RepID=A0A1T4L1K3_9ENTE|nr:NADP-dependent malic enzyme [Pilibacter termitis]SJZ48612.1 malate dehydrogenase (oxaloacetate-decarboxylating) [Pilibacter termitis]